jgi:DNA uptake protein ComE-like DNA-binding protein
MKRDSLNEQSISPVHYLIAVIAVLFSSGSFLGFAIALVVLECLYFWIKRSFERDRFDEHRNIIRKAALYNARIYLSPYSDIWKNLRLSNKYCYLKLGETASQITGGEKVAPYRKFTVITSHIHEYETLWELFCKSFCHNTTYQGLVESCNAFKVSIKETATKDTVHRADSELERSSAAFKPTVIENVTNTKVDINNCSEIELTELPGINIIMAKKIIKRRDEIKGFKNLDEFFAYVNVKAHIKTQLADKIVINKKKGSLKQERYIERKLDL